MVVANASATARLHGAGRIVEVPLLPTPVDGDRAQYHASEKLVPCVASESSARRAPSTE